MRPRHPRSLVYLTWLLSLLAVATLAVSLAPARGEAGRGSLHGSLVSGPPHVPVGITARLSERSDGDLARVVSRLRSAGVAYVKEDVSWRTLEPSRGVYDWSSMDRWVAAAAGGGLRIIALPCDAPRWAMPRWNYAPVRGSGRLADFSDFVRELVERYGNRGAFWQEHPELAARPIRYYDIWNEPYVRRFWGREFPDPGGYARMFKAVVKAARPADPGARFMLEADTRVLATGYPGKPFLAAMLRAVPRLGSYAYAVSVHPYQADGESPRECSRPRPSRGVRRDWRATVLDFCRIADIRRMLDAAGARRVRIWITEVGWSSAPRARNRRHQGGPGALRAPGLQSAALEIPGDGLGPGLVRVPEFPGPSVGRGGLLRPGEARWDSEAGLARVRQAGSPRPLSRRRPRRRALLRRCAIQTAANRTRASR